MTRYRRFVRASSFLLAVVVLGALASAAPAALAKTAVPVYFEVADGSHPHDVAAAPTPGGPVFFTAQRTGKLGILDAKTGKIEEVPLGQGSAPHGVIVGPDRAPWITDSGQNAIVRVDPKTREVRRWPLPEDAAERESQHRHVRPARPYLVYRTKRILRTARSCDRRHEGVESPARSRAVRHHDHAEWRGLLRVTCRQSHCPHRCRNRRSHRHRTADAGAGCAARLVRFARPHLGELLEHRPRA